METISFLSDNLISEMQQDDCKLRNVWILAITPQVPAHASITYQLSSPFEFDAVLDKES
jgi:hypothetical protein